MSEPTRTQKNANGMSFSDERLAELTRRTINASRLKVWSDQLQICCHNGIVRLSGCLPSFYLKQVLQTIVLNLPGVLAVENGVEVDTSSAAITHDEPPDVR